MKKTLEYDRIQYLAYLLLVEFRLPLLTEITHSRCNDTIDVAHYDIKLAQT